MALTRVRKDSFNVTLTLTGQGETVKINVTYFNRRKSELDAKLAETGNDGHQTLLYMIKEWDSEYPLTLEGIAELEDDRPGVIYGLIEGFHESRRMTKEKN